MVADFCRKLWVTAGSLRDDVRGIAALEYAVLAAILLVIIVAGIVKLNPASLFNSAAEAINSATQAAANAG